MNKLDVDEVELVLPVPSQKSIIETANETARVSGTQEKILKLMSKNRYITYEDIADKIGVSRATVGRNVRDLKKKGILLRNGEDKNGCWIVVAH